MTEWFAIGLTIGVIVVAVVIGYGWIVISPQWAEEECLSVGGIPTYYRDLVYPNGEHRYLGCQGGEFQGGVPFTSDKHSP